MSSIRTILSVNLENDPLRELFEACKTGDLVKIKKLITSHTVNARDTAGRKSTPLHFAAGTLRCLNKIISRNSQISNKE